MATKYLTLSPENQFQFTCPIFDTQVKFAQCARVRDAAYLGFVLPVRRGCQACVRDSKCPAAEVIRAITFNKDMPDDYGSTKPVHGKVRQNVLEKIAPVMVRQTTMDAMGVPPAERMLIESSSDRIRKSIGAAPLPGTKRPQSASVDLEHVPAPKRTTKPTPAPANNAVMEAAASGDLAAALNAA